jgi:hypothetical protein
MVKRLISAWMYRRPGLFPAIAGLLLCAPLAAWAQAGVPFTVDTSGGKNAAQSRNSQTRETRQRPLSDRLPDKPSLPPAYSIPIEPLGFSAPGSIYLGVRNSLVSLDFLDENRLLFTFRVPGLIRREPGDSEAGEERQIRAVVLTLPAGKVESEALWTVHDRLRYLWMLKDGHFLLRDRDGLAQGDAKLELKPYLQFPGPLLWLELDPTEQFLVTNSREPKAAAAKAGEVDSPENHPSDQDLSPGAPATAAAGVVADGQKPATESDPDQTDFVLRILRRDSGKVMLVSRLRSTVHLPINADGYLESLRGNGQQWALNLDSFSGGSTVLGRVDSACSPVFDFVSQREALVTACDSEGGRELVALSTGGRRLWEVSTAATEVWPLLVRAPDGSRLAQESLVINHAVNAYSPLDGEDVKGQLIRVFDAASGHVMLEAQASPVLDAGGNVAISPSGRRVAVIGAGGIQIFDLPEAPKLPDAAVNQTGR